MSIGMRILHGLLLGLVALAGTAVAQNQPCPECDADGEPVKNRYYSVDVGVLGNATEVLADTDVALSHSDDEKGFWSWLSLCLGAFLGGIEEMLGLHADVDAHAEAYVSEQGADLDATLHAPREACQALDADTREALGDDGSCALDFDRGAAGSLDGRTWEAMSGVNDVRRATGTDRLYETAGVGGEDLPGDLDVDVCAHVALSLPACA